MKIIGLTGGIGSGKSFVAKVATEFFPVLHISTDDVAKEQMKKGGISYQAVVNQFFSYDEKLLDEDGEINRKVLASIVFNNKMLLDNLNAITHPNVINKMNEMISEARKSGEYEAVLVESALIFESGINKICDSVWYVYAPTDCRIKRLMKSRGYSREKIDSIMDDQLDDTTFINQSDVIINNGDEVTVEEMVLQLCRVLMED